MKDYQFENSIIDLACEEIGAFLAQCGMERREALRLRLTLEEVLLEYQEKFGEEASFKIRSVNRFASVRIEVIVAGEAFEPFGKGDDEDAVIHGLLAGIGLAPVWSYKGGKNYISFTSSHIKTRLSDTSKMALAIVLAVAAGLVLNALPAGVSQGVNAYLLTPLSDAFMGLISAVSGPLIFLSVLGSICSMGNMETLGKIGSRTMKILFWNMLVLSVAMTTLGCLFYRVEWGGSVEAGFSQILDLIYGIIPSNLFEPFITGNTLQLIFISVMVGLAMLILSSKVTGVFSLVEQFTSIVQTIMSELSLLLPWLIFLLITSVISSGNMASILESWKIVAMTVMLMSANYIVTFVRTAVRRKVPPALLWKKASKTFMICLTTASSAAAFATNIGDAHKKLGIHKKLAEFGIPLGQVLYKPGTVALLFALGTGFAESCGITITVPWIIIGLITNLLVSFAIPPVPGGAMMGFTIAFSQLGIPMEMMGIALVINAIIDFPATATDISGWQLTMIDVAEALDMLDEKALHKDQK